MGILGKASEVTRDGAALPLPGDQSPPGGEVLPGPRPCTDQRGEGQGSQQREEAEEEQALDAVIADASEGIQVVLGRRRAMR